MTYPLKHPFDMLTVQFSRRTVFRGTGIGLLALMFPGSKVAETKNHRRKKPGKRKSKRAHSSGKKKPKEQNSKQDVATQVIGGSDVPDGTYPFLVAILKKNKRGKYPLWCGGNLISEKIVATAAHCLAGSTSHPGSFRVVIGRTDLRSPNGEGVEMIPTHAVIDPQYKGRRNYRDFAYLVLPEEVDTNLYPVIELPTSEDLVMAEPGQMLTVAGWGNTRIHGYNFPSRMKEAEVQVMTGNEADKRYTYTTRHRRGKRHKGKTKKHHDFNPAVMLAASAPGKDTCNGDSGGGIFGQRQNGQFVLFGFTSWGYRCASAKRPGVYSKLAAGMDFFQGALSG